MGKMKRLAMELEDQFYEIASEYMYIAETWNEYRDYMRYRKNELLSHLDNATYYNEIENELKGNWNDYMTDYLERNE
jgi:hypothetical protein